MVISPAGVKPAAFSRPVLHALLVVATALAFADSSIVVLAVPEIVDDFDVGVNSASWVITAYNLAVVVAGLVLLRLVRRFSPTTLAALGMIVFGAASAICAVAPNLAVLVTLRAVQGVGAAALLVAALPLLERPGRGAESWLLAATIGTAAGPALGGLLTEFFSWRSIFVVQIPVLALGIVALASAGAAAVPAPTVERLMPERRTGYALASLAALSASLVGALFLIIILLIAGLRWSPLPASLVATTLPVLALLAHRLTKQLPEVIAAVAGCLLVAGGLATLGLLPGPETALVIAGLALCGIGLGLASHPLGDRALGRSPSLAAGTRTVVARHAGLVIALLVVTPLLVHSFDGLRSDAEEVVGKTVLEAPIGLTTKIPLLIDLSQGASASQAAPPDVDAIFAGHGDGDPAVAQLKDDFTSQMDELVVRTFRPALLATAVFALLAAAAAFGLGQASSELRRRRAQGALAIAVVAGVAFVAVDIAMGATDDPVAAADPCDSKLQLEGGGLDFAVQRLMLKGVDAIACATGTTRVALLKRALGGDTSTGLNLPQLPQLPSLPPLSGLLPPGGPPTTPP
jgi:MFS family permease